jgi:DDE superfamily endonuclease
MSWLRHFDKFTASRTKGAYRLLIFDGYGSHVTQGFLQYCWDHKIRPYQLPAHSTHLTQPADVGAFQKFKAEFKKELRRHVYLGGDAITKTDFFAMFQTFSDRTWTPKLCRSAFRKTGLIPYNPDIVLNEMKKYGGIQETPVALIEREPSSSPAFATPPPKPWDEFNTPITFSQRKRGHEFVEERIENGPWPLTPIVKRVKAKCDKYVETNLQSGELAKARLESVLAYTKTVNDRNSQPGTIIQKYGEIYGSQARREIDWLDEEAAKTKNLIQIRREKKEAQEIEKKKRGARKLANQALDSANIATN